MGLDLQQVDRAVDTELARERVRHLKNIADSFYPEPIEDAFVSEYREQDGTQVFESLWFFTASYAAEFKDPLGREQFDLTPIKKCIRWLEATRHSFDSWRATKETRFSVEWTTTLEIHGTFKATGDNCLELLRIVRERFFPNIASLPAHI